MESKSSKFKYTFLLIDFVLLSACFFALNFLKRGTFVLSEDYLELLAIFYLIWFVISIVIKKFDKDNFRSYADAIAVFLKSAIYYIYFAALVIVILGLKSYSRMQVFGTWTLFFFAEASILSAFELISNRKTKTSLLLAFIDFFLLSCSFFCLNYYKRGTFMFNPEYEKIMIILFGVWFLTSFFTNKFDKRNPRDNYFDVVASCIKSGFIMIAIMSVLIFGFRLFYFSRLQIFGSILVLLLGELVLFHLYLITLKARYPERNLDFDGKAKNIVEQEALHLECDFSAIDGCEINTKANEFIQQYFSNRKWLLEFIKRSIDPSALSDEDACVIQTNTLSDLKTIDNGSKKIIINLHKLNDFRRINRYFLRVHNFLVNGGYLVGYSHTLATHKDHIYRKYPKYIRDVYYFGDFFFNRIIPKLPILKQIYFYVTKGKKRLISQAEILGRLFFCGFKLLDEGENNQRYYFVAQKVKTVSLDNNPSYGPIVKFKRYGFQNKIIYTYKFRTMYPYSEYIQDYIYRRHNLQRGGKFKNDFRISNLGKLLRKSWLDEIPMLYNWIKGELKLVGVRPLSLHYLSLYPDEIKELRKKVKPGLIPPYYVDLPETFEEIYNSEKKYIEAYLQKPLSTQCNYFCKAIYNILIRGARSK